MYGMVTASRSYETRFSIEDSIGVPRFRTDLEKVVRPGVRTPAEDGITAVLPTRQGIGDSTEFKRNR